LGDPRCAGGIEAVLGDADSVVENAGRLGITGCHAWAARCVECTIDGLLARNRDVSGNKGCGAGRQGIGDPSLADGIEAVLGDADSAEVVAVALSPGITG